MQCDNQLSLKCEHVCQQKPTIMPVQNTQECVCFKGRGHPIVNIWKLRATGCSQPSLSPPLYSPLCILLSGENTRSLGTKTGEQKDGPADRWRSLSPQNQNLEGAFALLSGRDQAHTAEQIPSAQFSHHVMTQVTLEILSWEANILQ